MVSIMQVMEAAKGIMRLSGNMHQWTDGYPSEAVILCDMEKGGGYIVEEDRQIVAYFAFHTSPEPTYAKIYDGEWLDDVQSYPLGLAIQKTGVAAWISQSILDISGSNPIVVMADICLVASVITEFLSNTAVAAMTVPIMYTAATQLGCDPLPFLIALLMAVGSSLVTPIGSSTNMLVYGPGGYRFGDFVRIGLPVKIVFLVVSIFFINIIYPLNL